MARKQWSTTLDEEKLKKFNEVCDIYGMSKNVILEALMDFFSEGKCRIVMDINGCRIEYKTDSENKSETKQDFTNVLQK